MAYEHKFDWLVAYPDTDAEGIVYHANYLKIADRARTAWFVENDVSFFDEHFVQIVYSVNMKFKAPATLGDKLCIITQVKKIGGATIHLQQNVFLQDKILCEIALELACVNPKTLKPIRVPAVLRNQLSKLLN